MALGCGVYCARGCAAHTLAVLDVAVLRWGLLVQVSGSRGTVGCAVLQQLEVTCEENLLEVHHNFCLGGEATNQKGPSTYIVLT